MQRRGSDRLNRLLTLTALMTMFAGCLSDMPPNESENEEAPVDTSEALKAELNFRISNVARGKTATQSSTAFGGDASRALDGNTDGDFNAGSVTHDTATQLVEAEAQYAAGNGASLDLVSLASSVDPTGLAAVGIAFAKPICK
jgi:hypothetical protein